MDCLNSTRPESKRLREWIPDAAEVDLGPNKKQAIENSNTDVSEVTDALDIASCGHNVSSKADVCCIDVTSPGTRKSSSDSNSSVSCSLSPTTTEDFKPSIVYGENGKLKIKLKCKVAGSVTSATSSLTPQNLNGDFPSSDGQVTKKASDEVEEPLNRRDSVGSSQNNLTTATDVSTSDTWHPGLSRENIELNMSQKEPLHEVPALEEKEGIISEICFQEEGKSYADATESFQEESSGVQQPDEKDEIIQQSQAHAPEECYPNIRQASPEPSSGMQYVCFDEKNLLNLDDSEARAWLPKKTSRPGFHSGSSSRKNTSQRKGKKRDNDLHRLLFMPNGLADGTWLGYCNKGETVLEGRKQGNGIFCSCCNTEISPSQFEAHAGWATRRQPYRHIYTADGLTLHDLSISLSKELATVNYNDSDDKCTKCGEEGELLICDGKCGRAFHIVCLGLQSVPEGDWFCPHCKDKHVSRKKTNRTHKEKHAPGPLTIRLRRVVKAPVIEIGGCVFCGGHDFSASAFNAQTVLLCDQCEREFHVGCLRSRGLCDLKELPKGKWFCSADCTRIHMELENRLTNGAETISASCITERKLEEKVTDDEAGDSVNWQVLSGKFGSSDHRTLLSKAAAIFRDCFDPIVEKTGRDLVPAMVYGRNIGAQDFGGMFCAVLIVNSTVVSAGIFRIFGMEVAELPLVATSKENQGKGYFKLLFSRIENLLSSLNVRSLILPAAEEAKSIWTNKFGFTEMTDDSLRQYSRYNQITMFHGTSMLEKAVPQIPIMASDEQKAV
ncbi:hypothetical protein H6P81_006518 [Aristolochia fimbriata]|uniref:PHD-type domain-containing protein n=1 Tax=Aristolochia fimbriata TaxID=158543 RepID=A0AAV7EYG8_ARIFI|nr:hypothetical protein H6P81_006518 [Aristolochia fimbriata]